MYDAFSLTNAGAYGVSAVTSFANSMINARFQSRMGKLAAREARDRGDFESAMLDVGAAYVSAQEHRDKSAMRDGIARVLANNVAVSAASGFAAGESTLKGVLTEEKEALDSIDDKARADQNNIRSQKILSKGQAAGQSMSIQAQSNLDAAMMRIQGYGDLFSGMMSAATTLAEGAEGYRQSNTGQTPEEWYSESAEAFKAPYRSMATKAQSFFRGRT